MLPKENKLNTDTYNDIFVSGKSLRSDGFIIKYKDLKSGKPSFAVVVSKKNAKNAIKRNYLRRVVYNEINKKIDTLPSFGFVFISTKQFVDAEKKDRKIMLEKLFPVLNSIKI